MQYRILDIESRPEDDRLYLTDYPAGARRAFLASCGGEAAPVWPELATFGPESVEGLRVLDLIPCSEGLLVVSAGARDVLLSALGEQPCEVLPAHIAREEGPLDVWVINPLVEYSALDPAAAGVEYDGSRIYQFARRVLDQALLDDAPSVFRLDGESGTILISEVVLSALEAAGVEGVRTLPAETVDSRLTSLEARVRERDLAAARMAGLIELAREGKTELVRLLIESGEADLDGDRGELWQDTAPGCITGAPTRTPLGVAAARGQSDVVQLLLEAGAQVDMLNHRAETALHQALASGEAATARLLLDAGASLTLAGNLGSAITACCGRVELIQMLLERGADPTIPDYWGKTAFDRLRFDLNDLGSREDREIGARRLAALELLLPAWPTEHAQLEALRTFVAQARAALAKVGTASRATIRRYEKLGIPGEGWADQVRQKLRADLLRDRNTIDLLVGHTLSRPTAVSHPDWGSLVLELAEKTPSYGDLAEDAYHQRRDTSQMGDDEGGVMEMLIDMRLATTVDALTLLAAPGAADRPDFPVLLERICTLKTERLGPVGFGDEEARALLERGVVKAREDYARLEALVRANFRGTW